MWLECANVLNPRPVLRDEFVLPIKLVKCFIAELDELEFKKRQMLAAHSAHFPLHGGMPGLDLRVCQVRALPQEKVRGDLSAEHFDFGVVAQRVGQQSRKMAFVLQREIPGHRSEFGQIGVETWVGNAVIKRAQVPADEFGALDGVFHFEFTSPGGFRSGTERGFLASARAVPERWQMRTLYCNPAH